MLERFITSLEETPMSVAGWLAGFFGIIWIRFFLEAFSSPSVSGYLPSDLPTLLHYTLFFLGIIVLAVAVVSVTARISAVAMLRVLLFGLPLIWLAPLIDLLRGGAHMSYLSASTPSALLLSFGTYFGSFGGASITFGLRLELGLALVLLGAYVYTHTKRLLPTLLAVFAAYAMLFVMASLPVLFAFALPSGSGEGPAAWSGALQLSLIARDFLHPSALYSAYRTLELLFDAAMAQAWYLVIAAAGLVVWYRSQPGMVRALARNVRPERVAHYLLAVVLGALIAFGEGSRIAGDIFDIVTLVVAALAVFFSYQFAITINDLVDEPIDAVSNRSRPLPSGALTRAQMHDVAIVYGLAALAGALALGSYATFWLFVFGACAYVYSAPPLRLKRIPLLATALSALATLALMLLGFFLISANQALAAFPAPIAFLVVIAITLIANARDLKDIEGDRAAGIWTLPTLLGERDARMLIGALSFLATLLVPIFIPLPLLWLPSILAGGVVWVGLVRGAGERFLFTLYFLYLASVVLVVAASFA